MTPERDDQEDPTLAADQLRPSDTPKSFVLVVIEGSSPGAKFKVDASSPNRCYAGKSPSCELRIDDPLTSRRHFAFEVRGARLRIEDLDSKNGTSVNGVLIHQASLRGGETILVGGTTLRVAAAEVGEPEPVPMETQFGRVLGASLAMRRLFPLCKRLASSTVPIIIEGETGTGKELLAESLHEQSPRAGGAFVVFDCTTVASGLVEASLFGHERGAFTGADKQRKGVFEQAHGGTLFIDELGDLELPLQAKLLRAIERSEVQRVGSTAWTRVDVRIICATRRDLEVEIQQKRFREDLFYRLAVARIELPPLRNREGDVSLLARTFWTQMATMEPEIPPGLLARLERHGWPGNVRELYNAIAHTVALGDAEHALGTRMSFVPPGVTLPALADQSIVARVLDEELPFARARERVQMEFQRVYVERALERHGGNVHKAAESSGISRRYFDMIRRGGSGKT